jgi:hypothetical protein
MTTASGLAVDKAARPPMPWAMLLKDAILAALVAILLALPLVGLQTYDIGGGALGISIGSSSPARRFLPVGWRCGSTLSSAPAAKRAERARSGVLPPGPIVRHCP